MPDVRVGYGAPHRRLGAEGDFYIDILAWTRHGPKRHGRWPAGVPIIPDLADDVPLATRGGVTLVTDAGAALAGDQR